jgi:hypothetical protein
VTIHCVICRRRIASWIPCAKEGLQEAAHKMRVHRPQDLALAYAVLGGE